MIKNFKIKECKNVEEFKDLVFREHKNGGFRGDPHKMQADFKLHKNSVGFISLYLEDEDRKIPGFVGLDVFESNGEKTGFIHCLGVTKQYRGQGLSSPLLLEVEKIAIEKYGIKSILSICNPISERSHLNAGYIVTNPGRLSPSGKRMQIRLKKDI